MERKHNAELTAKAKELRKNMTEEERFLRQKAIDHYIVDFYCRQARLIVELDGSQHYEDEGLRKDRIRMNKIESRNLTVIRIPNNEVHHNFRGVCDYIDMHVQKALSEKNPPVSLSSSPF